jgi:prepilin peptidase CpaA
MTLDLLRLFLFPALVAFAAASDLLTMTISNRVSLLLIAGFFAMAMLCGLGWQAIALHTAAGACVLVVAFSCFAMGWVGGGDAKVASAVALWFGFDQLLEFLVYASLFGGALTLLLLQFRQWTLPLVFYGQTWITRLHDKDTGVPYGIALAAGALVVYPGSPWMHAVDLTRFAIH